MDNIPGLYFYKDYFPDSCTTLAPCCIASKTNITTEELKMITRSRVPCQSCMLDEFDQQYINPEGILVDKFSNHTIRRVIHYGYNYNYTSKHITNDFCFSFDNSPTLVNLRILFGGNINQALVNEYTSKQNISKHIDSDVFGPIIHTISLGCPINYFMDKGANTNTVKFVVDPGDLIILTGDARSVWRHGTGTNSDKDYRRVSITLRQVK